MSHNTRRVELGKPEVLAVFDRADIARFWAKVNKDGPVVARIAELGPCWLWTSSRTGSLGYGQMGVVAPGAVRKQLNYYAHRIAWELSHGAVPPGQSVLHHCDNPICVNHAHLYIGNHTKNMQDAQARGRLNVPRPTAQRITDAQLAEMLALDSIGTPRIEIARRFAVSKSYVSNFLNGKSRQYSLPPIAAEKAS